MNDIALPLKIKRYGEALIIVDGNHRNLCTTHFRDTDLVWSDHWTREQAEAIAKMIARLVTDKLEG
ncbi:MAG: hypothetical protein AAF414_05755 [Pseudomonadota bacterium]